jgi:hypothetical protein
VLTTGLTWVAKAILASNPGYATTKAVVTDPVGYAEGYVKGLKYLAFGPLGRLSDAVVAPAIVGGISGRPIVIDKGEVAAVAIETAITFATMGRNPAVGAEASAAVEAVAEAEAAATGPASGARVAAGAGGTVEPAKVLREIAHGEKIADILTEVNDLRSATGLEYAVISRTNGTRALVYGGTGGIDFTNFPLRRLLGHSHPIGYPLPSGDDFLMLQSVGQRSSWIYEEGLLRFGVRPVP